MDNQNMDVDHSQEDIVNTLWTERRVLFLIELFRNESNLWNPRNSDYRNKNRKLDSYLQISRELGVDKSEVERKIKNITSHFYREKKKMDIKKSGCSGTEDNYKTKWFAYPYLEFLKDRNTPRSTQETEKLNTQSQFQDSMDANASISNLDLTNDTTQTQQQTNSEELCNSNTNPEIKEIMSKNKETEYFPKKARTKRKHEEQEDVKDETFAMFKEMYESRKNCDEFSLLGKEVELKVRNLPTNYARCIVKHKIQTILFEASLGMYNNPQTQQYPNYQQPIIGLKTTWIPSGPSSTQSNSTVTTFGEEPAPTEIPRATTAPEEYEDSNETSFLELQKL